MDFDPSSFTLTPRAGWPPFVTRPLILYTGGDVAGESEGVGVGVGVGVAVGVGVGVGVGVAVGVGVGVGVGDDDDEDDGNSEDDRDGEGDGDSEDAGDGDDDDDGNSDSDNKAGGNVDGGEDSDSVRGGIVPTGIVSTTYDFETTIANIAVVITPTVIRRHSNLRCSFLPALVFSSITRRASVHRSLSGATSISGVPSAKQNAND